MGVMKMKFTNLTAKEFSDFTDRMTYSHFTQMTENYELKVAEKTETHLVGIKNKDNECMHSEIAESCEFFILGP